MHIVMLYVYCSGAPPCLLPLYILITCLFMDTNMLLSVIVLERHWLKEINIDI